MSTTALPLAETSDELLRRTDVDDTRGPLAGTGSALHSPVPAIEPNH